MKRISIRYQMLISMLILIFVVFGVIYTGLNIFLPEVYENQIQEDLKQEITRLDLLISTSSESVLAFNITSFVKESPFKIDIYNVFGRGIFESAGKELTTQTKILLLEGPIQNQSFDGNRSFFTRTEKTEVAIMRMSFDVASFYQMLEVMNILTLYMGLLGVVVALAMSFIMSRQMTNPIIKLTENVVNNSLIKPLQRNDEIGKLSQSISSYQTDIESLVQKLTNELSREKDQDLLMKTFIANTSHEIQTPLSIMFIALETLEDKIIPQDNKQMYTQIIKSEIIHLEHLIKDMMILSQGSLDKLELDLGHHALNVILEEIKTQFQMMYKDADIVINVPKKTIYASIDKTKFKQVLYNIIHNAIMHQKETKEVRIQLKTDKGLIRLSICNPNSKIDLNDLPHLFDAFYKVNSKGKGLGLAIVKSILDLHKILYAYENNDEGVCFHMNWSE